MRVTSGNSESYRTASDKPPGADIASAISHFGLVPHPDSCSAASFGQIGDAVSRDREVGAAKGTAVIPVLNQYKSIGCSPGKHPDTRTTATGSDDDSRDSVHDRCLCIAA